MLVAPRARHLSRVCKSPPPPPLNKMIESPCRLATLILSIAALLAAYQKSDLVPLGRSLQWLQSTVNWLARVPDPTQAGREPNIRAGPQGTGPGASQQHSFVWSDKIQDWTLSRAAPPELSGPQEADRCLWPEDSNCPAGDRIISQLRLRPRRDEQGAPISIGLAHEPSLAEGGRLFSECHFERCQIRRNLYEADAIIVRDSDLSPIRKHWPRLAQAQMRRRQIWIAHLLESPPNTFDPRFERPGRSGRQHQFNWTAAYRADADIVTPYSKFVPYADRLDEFLRLRRRHAAWFSDRNKRLQEVSAPQTPPPEGQTKEKLGRVAWLVSNCHARNNRLEFARELSKHIQVDVYGKCGNFTCAKWSQSTCLERLNARYKFYLSFENSNNRDYITEKFYQNALGYNEHKHRLLPVVMGPSRADYERLAPPHSFVHVDDFKSSKELADYLKELDSNERLYSAYFEWKTLGQFIDTKFLCRVCALMHRARSQARVKTYVNLRAWWLELD